LGNHTQTLTLNGLFKLFAGRSLVNKFEYLLLRLFPGRFYGVRQYSRKLEELCAAFREQSLHR
jgi:hypothetical protein